MIYVSYSFATSQGHNAIASHFRDAALTNHQNMHLCISKADVEHHASRIVEAALQGEAIVIDFPWLAALVDVLAACADLPDEVITRTIHVVGMYYAPVGLRQSSLAREKLGLSRWPVTCIEIEPGASGPDGSFARVLHSPGPLIHQPPKYYPEYQWVHNAGSAIIYETGNAEERQAMHDTAWRGGIIMPDVPVVQSGSYPRHLSRCLLTCLDNPLVVASGYSTFWETLQARRHVASCGPVLVHHHSRPVEDVLRRGTFISDRGADPSIAWCGLNLPDTPLTHHWLSVMLNPTIIKKGPI